MRKKKRTVYKWECVRCGSTGSSEIEDGTDLWSGVQIMLSLHRAISPECDGGIDTIRISGKPPKPSGGSGHAGASAPPHVLNDETPRS